MLYFKEISLRTNWGEYQADTARKFSTLESLENSSVYVTYSIVKTKDNQSTWNRKRMDFGNK